MSFFYRDGHLCVGTPAASVEIAKVAHLDDRPTYVYDLDDIEMRFELYREALSGLNSKIHYAMKANGNSTILKKLRDLGAGVDTVSAGEMKLAIEAGFQPSQIIFSGVAKTVREIEFAVQKQIKQINVESPAELKRIAEVATRLNQTAQVAFRLNPDVDAKTHPYISTGFRENKFGMDESFVPELVATLRSNPRALKLRGLTMHIGSLLFDLGALQSAIEKTCALHRRLNEDGFELDRIDIGGGLGIRYETDDTKDELRMLQHYGAMVQRTLKHELGDLSKIEVLVEPGRMIVGRAGLLVSRVQYIKTAPAKTFAIVDTGMHHLLRPALYQAKHRILAVRKSAGQTQTYDVVGPICESSDVLAKSVALEELSQGDLLAMADCGAYGFTMASRYNVHELPNEVVVAGGRIVS